MTDTTTPSTPQTPAAGSSAPGALPDKPATAADAVTQLAALKADKSFTDALMSGAPAPKERFHELHAMIEGGATPSIDLAMSGQFMPGGVNTPEHLEQMGVAAMFQEAGLRPELVKQVLGGKHFVTPVELEQLRIFKAQKFSDKEWVTRLFAGDALANTERHLMAVIESSPVKAA